MSLLIELNEENFEEFLQNNPSALVDVYADWCGPCKMIAPILEKVSEKYQDQITIGKLNVDKNRDLATSLGIRNIPTLLYYKEANLEAIKIGNISEDKIVEIFS